MDSTKIMEKISWKLHRLNFKFIMCSFSYDGSNSSFDFTLFGFVKDFTKSSLLAWSFRLPNKTHVRRFVTDRWDFLFMRNFLYEKYDSLIDKEIWSRDRMTRWDKIKLKVLTKLF